jgi:hypothetical protein
MTIQHIDELFVLDGADFVSAAYRTLLGREPDPHGLTFYLGRLARGYDKAEIIVNLSTAPEARNVSSIRGVDHLIAEHRRSQHWFWGWFGRSRRIERSIRQIAQASAHVHASIQQLSKALHARQENLQHMAPAPLQHGAATQAIVVQRLSADEVRQAFIDVLGREPENSDVIAHHANFESPQQLRTALMRSVEFRNKAEGEHAKFLLGHLCQALNNKQYTLGV